MACCGRAAAAKAEEAQANKGNFMLRNADGSVAYFDTELAARAANARKGGTGLVRKVR